MKNFLFLALGLVLLSSCSTKRSIGNGAYSDISLERSSDQYTLKRLKEVNSQSKAIFGIPVGNQAKKEGIVVRFNGINLGAQQKFLPAFSMVALSVVTGSAIYGAVGNEFDEEALAIGVSVAGAVPIAGFLNNQIWSDSALRNAAWNANSSLLNENKNIDVFLNPKYEIQTSNGIFTQKANLKANVMGAIIKTDE